MLLKPDIPDDAILACLRREYGLPITRLTFLPIGNDLCTAVYRAVARDETAYFCKLRCADFDPISVELPKFLSDQGIPQIIPPILTQTGRLWAVLDAFFLILYPFVEGSSGFDVELTARHWSDFGAALKRVHTTRLPPALSQKIQQERFSPEARESCKAFLQRLDEGPFDDPILADLAAYLAPRRATILDLIQRAESYAQILASRSPEFVLCHSDIHPGNLFIAPQGPLYIVDWDYPMLAPKERDLMFIGGGQGYVRISAAEEEALFYPHYGPPAIDPVALAYYRCERNLVDLSVECPKIFSSAVNPQERAFSLQIITWLFLPGGSVEMAYKAAGKINKVGPP